MDKERKLDILAQFTELVNDPQVKDVQIVTTTQTINKASTVERRGYHVSVLASWENQNSFEELVKFAKEQKENK